MKMDSRTSRERLKEIETDKEIRDLARRFPSLNALERKNCKALVLEQQRKILKRHPLVVLLKALGYQKWKIMKYNQEKSQTHQDWLSTIEQDIKRKARVLNDESELFSFQDWVRACELVIEEKAQELEHESKIFSRKYGKKSDAELRVDLSLIEAFLNISTKPRDWTNEQREKSIGALLVEKHDIKNELEGRLLLKEALNGKATIRHHR